MPHTSLRRRQQSRQEATGEPAHLAIAGLPVRGGWIATSPGQDVFQAVLMQAFLYRERHHPWDARGMELSRLYGGYGTWLSPQAGRVVFGSTLASRMCAYLLPFVTSRTDGPVCSGIPGLRYKATRPWGYLLHHLPTDTRVEVHQYGESYEESLRWELTRRRGEQMHDSNLWQSKDLDEAEHYWDAAWLPRPHTNLYSALFNAAPVLLDNRCPDDGTAEHASLTPAAHAQARAILSWCGSLTPRNLIGYLQDLSVCAGNKPLRYLEHAENFALLHTDDGPAVELHQRSSCATCSRHRLDALLVGAA